MEPRIQRQSAFMNSRAKYISIRFLFAASALFIVLAGRTVRSQAVQTASLAAPPTPRAAFDVADVQASAFARVPRMDGPNLVGSRYVLRRATMTEMIAVA